MAFPELVVEANIAELAGDQMQLGEVLRFENWVGGAWSAKNVLVG